MNIFKKIKTIIYPVDLSIPNPKLKRREDLASTFNELKQSSDNLNKGFRQFMLAKAKVLNSGVIEKDGTLWANMN